MTNTNSFGQPTDESGHVLKESEIVAADLMKMLGDGGPLLQRVTEYVMQQSNSSYYRGLKLGIDIGRKEAQAIIDSAKEAQK